MTIRLDYEVAGKIRRAAMNLAPEHDEWYDATAKDLIGKLGKLDLSENDQQVAVESLAVLLADDLSDLVDRVYEHESELLDKIRDDEDGDFQYDEAQFDDEPEPEPQTDLRLTEFSYSIRRGIVWYYAANKEWDGVTERPEKVYGLPTEIVEVACDLIGLSNSPYGLLYPPEKLATTLQKSVLTAHQQAKRTL